MYLGKEIQPDSSIHFSFLLPLRPCEFPTNHYVSNALIQKYFLASHHWAWNKKCARLEAGRRLCKAASPLCYKLAPKLGTTQPHRPNISSPSLALKTTVNPNNMRQDVQEYQVSVLGPTEIMANWLWKVILPMLFFGFLPRWALGNYIFSSPKLKSSSSVQVEFKHVGRSANTMADALGKQGVDIDAPFVALTM